VQANYDEVGLVGESDPDDLAGGIADHYLCPHGKELGRERLRGLGELLFGRRNEPLVERLHLRERDVLDPLDDVEHGHARLASFFATLKVELNHAGAWRTRVEAHRAISEYIELFYNGPRRHSTIGYLSPVAFERQWQQTAMNLSTKSGQAHMIYALGKTIVERVADQMNRDDGDVF